MQDIFACYQCRECAAQCPLGFWFDVPPPRVLKFFQEGNMEAAMRCRTLWLCASCEKCTTACPHRLDLAKVMGRTAVAALELGFVPLVSQEFGRAVLADVDIRQRATQLGLLAPNDNPLDRLFVELNWGRHRLVKQIREFLRRRISPITASGRYQSPMLAEWIVAALFTVLGLPMALGLSAAFALRRLEKTPTRGGIPWH